MEINYRIGEFDLTLDAIIESIRSGDLSIYNVPISDITRQFLDILEKLAESLQIDDLSFFYRRVSELLYLKSQILLPGESIDFDDDEEGKLRNRVIDALEKLKFSKYSDLLERYRERHMLDFSRLEGKFCLPYSDSELLDGIRLNDLCITFNKLLEKINGNNPEFTFASKINPQQKLALLLELFENKDVVKFTELVVDLTSIRHITCAFFAILEAINDGICTFSQDNNYDEIYLYRASAYFDNLKEEVAKASVEKPLA